MKLEVERFMEFHKDFLCRSEDGMIHMVRQEELKPLFSDSDPESIVGRTIDVKACYPFQEFVTEPKLCDEYLKTH